MCSNFCTRFRRVLVMIYMYLIHIAVVLSRFILVKREINPHFSSLYVIHMFLLGGPPIMMMDISINVKILLLKFNKIRDSNNAARTPQLNFSVFMAKNDPYQRVFGCVF